MANKYKPPFEPNTLVKCADKTIRQTLQLKEGDPVLYLGEIRKMAGHCIVVLKSGKVIWGFHTDNFVELTEEEI